MPMPEDHVLVLEAGGRRYGVDLTDVERVQPCSAVTPLPGLPPPWAGLVNVRGEILPALDVPAYLGWRPAAGRGPVVDCAVVSSAGLRVAFLSEAPVALAGRGEAGSILDVGGILADPALVVDD